MLYRSGRSQMGTVIVAKGEVMVADTAVAIVRSRQNANWRDGAMNKPTFSLLAGAAALFVSAAQAGPLTNSSMQVTNDGPVVMVQDRHDEPRRTPRGPSS